MDNTIGNAFDYEMANINNDDLTTMSQVRFEILRTFCLSHELIDFALDLSVVQNFKDEQLKLMLETSLKYQIGLMYALWIGIINFDMNDEIIMEKVIIKLIYYFFIVSDSQ